MIPKPGSAVLYSAATGLERAMADADAERQIAIDAEAIIDVWDPYRISLTNLPYLAWGMGVNYWVDGWRETTKRDWTARQWEFKSLRGTLGGIRMVVDFAGRDVTRYGYEVVSATLPPQMVFSGASLGAAEREIWLQQLPQLRVWRVQEAGFADIQKAFLGGRGGVRLRDGRFCLMGAGYSYWANPFSVEPPSFPTPMLNVPFFIQDLAVLPPVIGTPLAESHDWAALSLVVSVVLGRPTILELTAPVGAAFGAMWLEGNEALSLPTPSLITPFNTVNVEVQSPVLGTSPFESPILVPIPFETVAPVLGTPTLLHEMPVVSLLSPIVRVGSGTPSLITPQFTAPNLTVASPVRGTPFFAQNARFLTLLSPVLGTPALSQAHTLVPSSFAVGATVTTLDMPIGGGGSIIFGGSTSDMAGQTFIAQASTLTTAYFVLRRGFTGQDFVFARVLLCDAGGLPTATQIGAASSVVFGASLPTSGFGYTQFTFADPVPLTIGLRYAVVVGRTGALSDGDPYLLAINNANPYPDGMAVRHDVGAWTGFTTLDAIAFFTFGAVGVELGRPKFNLTNPLATTSFATSSPALGPVTFVHNVIVGGPILTRIEERTAGQVLTCQTFNTSPSANCLLLVIAAISSNGTAAGTPTISGGGLTYLERASSFPQYRSGSPGQFLRTHVWTAPIGASPPGTLNITVSDATVAAGTGCIILSVWYLQNYNTTSPIGSYIDVTAGDGPLTITLPSAPGLGNTIFAFRARSDTGTFPTGATPQSPFFEVDELGSITGGLLDLEIMRRDHNTSTTVSWLDTSTQAATSWARHSVVLEFKAKP